jgi:GNAT superfamily N-acetyltransferase
MAALSRILLFAKEAIYLRRDGILFELQSVQCPFPFTRKIPYTITFLNEPVDLSHLLPDLTLEDVRARLKNGEYCYVVMFEQKHIGTIWFTNKKIYFPGIEHRVSSRSKWLPVNKQEGYVYRIAVDKEFRGNNILIDMLNFVIQTANELGIKKLTMSTGIDNIPVRKTALRTGWNLKCIVRCRRYCGILSRKEEFFNLT